MKNILIFTLLIIPMFFVYGQNEQEFYLEFSFGLSKHGSGDTSGYHYGINYGEEFSNKLYWQLGFEGTINDAPYFELYYEFPDGEQVDATLHTVTAGFQIAAGIKYNFIQTTNQQFGISFLPLFRYQATSLMDRDTVLYPAATGLPIPTRESVRYEPARTFAIGGSLRINYNFIIGNDFYLGLLGAFQIDSNGDTLPHFNLVLGKRF